MKRRCSESCVSKTKHTSKHEVLIGRQSPRSNDETYESRWSKGGQAREYKMNRNNRPNPMPSG